MKNKNSILEQKKRIRTKYRNIRKNIKNKKSADQSIADNLLKILESVSFKIISLYRSIDYEVNTDNIIKDLKTRKCPIVIPNITEGRILNFNEIDKEDKLNKKDPDLLVVPLIAFNKDCARLGFGGGYFDATIKHLRQKNQNLFCIGVAYQCQHCKNLPTEDHDQKLDVVITEAAIYFKRQYFNLNSRFKNILS